MLDKRIIDRHGDEVQPVILPSCMIATRVYGSLLYCIA